MYQFIIKALRVPRHLFLEHISHLYYTCPCITRHENVFIDRFAYQFIVFTSPDSAYGRRLRAHSSINYVKK
jgi:hypothetical protein